MSAPQSSLEPEAVARLLGQTLSRRAMLRHAAAFSLSAPAVASLLAACNGDEDDEPDDTPDPVDDEDDEDDEDETPDTSDDGDIDPSIDREESLFGDLYEPPQHEGGILIQGTFVDAQTVNAVLTSDTSSDRIIDLIANPVIGIHPLTVEPIPFLATSIDISDDGLVYTFPLRQDVTWHDGELFTADDVAFTYELHLNPDANSPRYFQLEERVESISVLDAHTIEFRLNVPVSAFLAQDMIHNIVPEHVLADVSPSDLASHPFSTGEQGVTIGTGPFMFEDWVRDDHVTLVRNPTFFLGAPFIDQFIYRVVPSDTVLAQQLRTGEVHLGAILPTYVRELDESDVVNVVEYDTFSFTFYAYQLDPEKTTLFQEQEVRHALAYALDREALVETISFGFGEVAIGTMPSRSWAYDPDGIELRFEYDPDRAAQILDDAGWIAGDDGVREKDGQRLSFDLHTHTGNEIRAQYVTVMQEQWRAIGVECSLQLEDPNAFIERIAGHRDFEIFLFGFSWGVDPDQSPMWQTGAGFNVNGYDSPIVNELLDEGLLVTDLDARTEIYTRMQNVLLEDLPSVILDFPQGLIGVNVRAHNVFPGSPPSTEVINAHEWWIEE